MNKSKKLGDTSIRVLETLKILINGNARIQDIIGYFAKTEPDNRIFTHEVILKYFNTFKVFGFKLIKEKDKYILLNILNQIDLNENDLKAINLLEKFAEAFPEQKVKTEVKKFLQDLENRFSDNTRMLSRNIKKTDFTDLKIDYDKQVKQIKEYEKYCADGQRIKITYKKSGQSENSVIVEPNEIKYIGNNVYFSVYNPVSAQIQNINFCSILKIEQLPVKSNYNKLFSPVTFELKGRLAKAYNLHESEELFQIKPDGDIIILNRQEDRTLLMKRLMRYGENCEVISPKTFREEMAQLIQSTLNSYLQKS